MVAERSVRSEESKQGRTVSIILVSVRGASDVGPIVISHGITESPTPYPKEKHKGSNSKLHLGYGLRSYVS